TTSGEYAPTRGNAHHARTGWRRGPNHHRTGWAAGTRSSQGPDHHSARGGSRTHTSQRGQRFLRPPRLTDSATRAMRFGGLCLHGTEVTGVVHSPATSRSPAAIPSSKSRSDTTQRSTPSTSITCSATIDPPRITG